MDTINIDGYAGKDAELRYMPDGTGVCQFSIASSRGRDESKYSIWYQVSVFSDANKEGCSKRAEETAVIVHKGSHLKVEGQLVCDKATGNPKIWVDDQNKAHARFEVKAWKVEKIEPVMENHTV